MVVTTPIAEEKIRMASMLGSQIAQQRVSPDPTFHPSCVHFPAVLESGNTEDIQENIRNQILISFSPSRKKTQNLLVYHISPLQSCLSFPPSV